MVRRRLDWKLVLAITLAGIDLVMALAALPILARTPNWSQDYVAYRLAALRLASEVSLYDRLSLQGAFEPLAQDLYLYPPRLGIAVGPLAALPADEGAIVWYLLHVAVLGLACALMPLTARTRTLTFAVAIVSWSVLRDLVMGNVSVLLLLPMVVAWRWLDRPVGSLALALATSVRVTFGIFLLWFLVRRAWRPLPVDAGRRRHFVPAEPAFRGH